MKVKGERGGASKVRAMRPALPKMRLPRADGRVGSSREHSLEYTVLITATLCLIAIGSVMVYSATSATSLLEARATAVPT